MNFAYSPRVEALRQQLQAFMDDPENADTFEFKSVGTQSETDITGQVDAIAVGRAALRDPYLPLRWAADLGARSWDEAPWPIQYWRGTWS